MSEDNRARFSDLWAWLERVLIPNPGWTLMELGVGPAGFAPFYAERVAKVIGVDVTDFSASYPGMEFILSDGQNIALENESIDIVVSHSVLEHVEDLSQTLREVNRVLRVGGYAFLTVSPLYYSATGSHVSVPVPLENWEHLDPKHPGFMTVSPGGLGRDALNGLTVAQLLTAVGHLPWDIHRFEIRHDAKQAPSFVFEQGVSPMDAYTREFRLVAHKRFRFNANGPAVVESVGYQEALRIPEDRRKNALLQARIQELEKSRSWRMTGWLRHCAEMMRRLRTGT